jgi:hypothetical protein
MQDVNKEVVEKREKKRNNSRVGWHKAQFMYSILARGSHATIPSDELKSLSAISSFTPSLPYPHFLALSLSSLFRKRNWTAYINLMTLSL